MTYEFFVIHVVRGACNARIVLATLPDEFEKVVDTGKDVIHENDGIKILVLCVAQLVQRNERSVSHLREVLDAVIESTPLPHRCANGDAHANAACERVKYAQESLRLVCRPVLVDRDKDIMVPKNGCYAKERCKEVRDDVERVVQIDSKEIFVLARNNVTASVVGVFIAPSKTAEPV